MQMLMPGGRLWQYHERRNIEGIYYDAPVDHTRASHGSIPLAGGRFSYLGAVVGKYHFGYLETGDGEGFEIGAIVGQDGASPQYLTADQAFAKIIRSL